MGLLVESFWGGVEITHTRLRMEIRQDDKDIVGYSLEYFWEIIQRVENTYVCTLVKDTGNAHHWMI